eukprot:COSAG01_NODE_42723_length_437_cov_0.887574_1_plen_129_part_10
MLFAALLCVCLLRAYPTVFCKTRQEECEPKTVGSRRRSVLVLAAILLGVCLVAVVYITTISCCTMCRREAWESSPWVVLSRKANSTNPANSLEVQAQGTWQLDGRLRVGHCHDQPRNQSGSCINRALTP